MRTAVLALALPALVEGFAPLSALPSVGRSNVRATQSLGLRMEWLKTVDPASGATYWYDTNTLETSWQPPAETKVSPKAAPVGGAALPKRGEPGYGQGAGLPVAKEDWDFPGMNLIFGEAMLKDILVPEWQESQELDNWGNPLPNASQATIDAWKKLKQEQKLQELQNEATYPYSRETFTQ